MIRKTSAMVEAGILAAVAIVMALISMYVPVLGAFVNFVWPLPIVICGCRHGFCGACATIYRIKGKNELKTWLEMEHYDAVGCYSDYRDDYQSD